MKEVETMTKKSLGCKEETKMYRLKSIRRKTVKNPESKRDVLRLWALWGSHFAA